MIETARKEDLFLDKKLIIPENRLDAIRIMARLHPVVGDQPTNEKDQPNTNNPVLDLACTILNIHESGVGVDADLRKIQNEPPKYFYGKGFMSGISSLKGNGILAVYGQWRDASGRYAIKQFYYTDKEILWRNAVSDTAWSAWFDVLTGNSDLDYNKLLNVPLTSTLSDDKTKIASIFAVNNVNRAAVNAQKTANRAQSDAADAMSEAKKKVEPKDVKKESLLAAGAYYTTAVPELKAGDHGLTMGINFTENNPGLDFSGIIEGSGFVHYFIQANYGINNLVGFFNGYNDPRLYIATKRQNGTWTKPALFYSSENTRIDSKGVIHEGTTTPIDVLLVGDYGFGTPYRTNAYIEDGNRSPNHFFNSPRSDLPDAWSGNDRYIGGWISQRDSRPLAFFHENSPRLHLSHWDGTRWGTSHEFLTTFNTTTDPYGFLRSFGNAVALTTDKLTSDLKVNRSDLIASAKYAYDVYQAALAADKKAVNAQTTANTAVANAKTAQVRADAAFTRVKPISEGGTGATTAANARKNLGIQTTNVLVVTGTIAHGGTIPIPAGFSVSECSFFVSTDKMNPEEEKWDIQETSRQMHFKSECFVSNRVVTCRMWVGTHYGPTHTTDPSRWINGIANYMVIGVKK